MTQYVHSLAGFSEAFLRGRNGSLDERRQKTATTAAGMLEEKKRNFFEAIQGMPMIFTQRFLFSALKFEKKNEKVCQVTDGLRMGLSFPDKSGTNTPTKRDEGP